MSFPSSPHHQVRPITPSLKYSDRFKIVFVSGELTVSVFAAVWCRRCLCFLLCFFLSFFFLIIIFEEQKRKHAEDTADPNTDGFTLHTGEELKKILTNHNERKWVLNYLHKNNLVAPIIALSFPVNELLAFDLMPNYYLKTKLAVIILFYYAYFVLLKH